MKKFLSYILTAICFLSLISCTSPSEDMNKVADIADEVQDYVQKAYDTKVEFVSTDRINDDYYYTYKDVNGFEFTVDLNCIQCDWWPKRTYNASDNYIAGYLKAHPKNLNVFKMEGHDFRTEKHGQYVLYYDSYYDIDEAAEFALKYIDKIELPKINYAKKPESLSYMNSKRVKLYFKPKGLDYEWNNYKSMEFPYESYQPPEELSKQIKSWHIQQLQRNDDTEHLSRIPDEDIKKYGK
ncbi:hypothetical protein [Ruminococcus flavefaciens]|uniref:hypothetical protein n=1 Tax=Ruminococcus flavefaciens TaxID=1265 RepID=UPI00046653F9|nr:hypothetical protein [Ruminococcus flavefaciens]